MTIEKKTSTSCSIKGAEKIRVKIHCFSSREKGYELYFYKETENGEFERVIIKWFFLLRDFKEFLAKYETEEELLQSMKQKKSY